MPLVVAGYDDVALLTVLVPAGDVPCQYHVVPEAGVPDIVNVCGPQGAVVVIGVGGVIGKSFTVTAIEEEFALQHPFALIRARK